MSGAGPRVLDPDVRRRAGGRLLLGGAPARLLRLSAAGSAALDRLLAGTPAPGDEALDERLRAGGLLHPVADAPAEVTFVIPVRDGGESLPRLVGRLCGWGPVLVVDDGSGDGSGARAEAAGARVLRNTGGARGPAAARNLGLGAAGTDCVAFVDADCSCEGDWARPLAGLLAADPGLMLAAPRVHGAAGGGTVARYERERSPLDMGERPGLVGPGRRIAYVPSAALVARRAALAELGGFDVGLRFGEDVDLVRRALAEGWTVRYAPEVEVEHLPRGSVAELARQRFEYGGSAVALDRRDPGGVAPLTLDRGTTLIGLGLLAGGRRGAAIGALAHLLWTPIARRDREAAPALAQLAGRGLAHSGRQAARAASRDWLPLTALAVLLSRRARPYAAGALAIDAAAGAARDPRLLLPPAPLLRVLENAAYAAGLWQAALRARSFGALLPRRRRGRGAGRARPTRVEST